MASTNIDETIELICKGSNHNRTLIISEKENKIYLPYTTDELEMYLKYYPESYSNLEEVVRKEFILPVTTFSNHPYKSRFIETYNLMRNREDKNIIISFIYAIILFGMKKLNPAIIAACKTKKELEKYIDCLKDNNLENFKIFKTIYKSSVNV